MKERLYCMYNREIAVLPRFYASGVFDARLRHSNQSRMSVVRTFFMLSSICWVQIDKLLRSLV